MRLSDKVSKSNDDWLDKIKLRCETKLPSVTSRLKYEFGLDDFLKDYQKVGVEYIWKRIAAGRDGAGVILADFMGLGKTIQVITKIDSISRRKKKNKLNVLVIAPAIVVANWISEFDKWLGNDMEAMGLIRPVKLMMGYEMFRLLAVPKSMPKQMQKQFHEIFTDPGPDMIILDEGHRIRKVKSVLTVALKKVRTKRRIIMTGYPIQNRLKEYWCMVDFARPGYLGSYETFKERFELPIKHGSHKDSSEIEVTHARRRSYVLNLEMKGLVLRRGPEVLYAMLPNKTEWVICTKNSALQGQLYRAFLNNRKQHVGEDGKPTNGGILQAYHISLMIVNHPDILYQATPFVGHEVNMNKVSNSGKMMLLMRILYHSCRIGDRISVFSQSLGTLEVIAKQIKRNSRVRMNYLKITGSTSLEKRFDMIKRFNCDKDESNVMLISTKAGGEGVNLVGGNRIVIFDACWNPCHDHEAMCRSHRYGQKKACYVYRLVGAGTMEKKIYELQLRKEGLSKRVVDSKATERHFTESDMSDFLSIQKYREADNKEVDDVSHRRDDVKDDEVMKSVLHERNKWMTEYYRQDSMLNIDKEGTCKESEYAVAIADYKSILRGNEDPAYSYPRDYSYGHQSHLNGQPNQVNQENCVNINCPHCRSQLSITKNPPYFPFIVHCPVCSKPIRPAYQDGCLAGARILLIKRGINNFAQLKVAAEAIGAKFVKLPAQATHIVTSFQTQEKVLRWLQISEVPASTYATPPFQQPYIKICRFQWLELCTSFNSGLIPTPTFIVPKDNSNLSENQFLESYKIVKGNLVVHRRNEIYNLNQRLINHGGGSFFEVQCKKCGKCFAIPRKAPHLDWTTHCFHCLAKFTPSYPEGHLAGAKILLIKRGINNHAQIIETAEAVGATFVSHVSMATHVVSTLTMEKCLEWFAIPKFPDYTTLQQPEWLIRIISKVPNTVS
eukprot:GSMAST32.ASY1.ANO1.301.1 assembled CDS